eukprot:TRINITY_DN13806_c0_g1_i1.p1 TRINITY_DN13806_c0_g1~~TRINITY_DN13806_c0_g1_i1.p1  ORF type:complete len:709 (+),score=102.91 TRINITY_DN13806_c0_g1_i1:72-2198(+)
MNRFFFVSHNGSTRDGGVGGALTTVFSVIFICLVLQLFLPLARAQSSLVDLFVDPVNGVDANTCGLPNEEPCASLNGLFDNNKELFNSTNGTLYALRLHDGNYTGSLNTNVRVPESVVEISSVSMNAQTTYFYFSGSLYSPFPTLMIYSSISIYNISFVGIQDETFILINSNINDTFLLSGVTIQGAAQVLNLVSAGLSAGSSLIFADISVNWTTSSSLQGATLLSVYNVNDEHLDQSWCKNQTASTWPKVIINHVQVQNFSAVDTVPILLSATDVSVSISDVVWSAPVETLVSITTACIVSEGINQPNWQQESAIYNWLPTVSISSLTAYNFTYSGETLISIVGSQVSLSDCQFFNIGFSSSYLINVSPYSSVTFSNSQFNNIIRSNNWNSTSSIVYVEWNAVSQKQLSSFSNGTNIFQNLDFNDNSLQPLTFVLRVPMNSEPIEANGISIQIDSCQFINNNNTGGQGGAISAFSELAEPKSTLSIANSLFNGNVASNYGGGIFLNTFAADITNSTFANNVVVPLLSNFKSDRSFYDCNLGSPPNITTFLGGGGISLTGNSLLSLSQNVKIIGNQVIPPTTNQTFSTIVSMSGAIFCCNNVNVTNYQPPAQIIVKSDRSTTFDNNSAPTAPDISCSDNVFDPVTCDFEGPIRETLHCDPGFPLWTLIGVVGAVIILLASIIGLVIYKIRQRRKQQQESLPLLGAGNN